MAETQETSEEPPNRWWKKHKEDLLIWTSVGSFIISLFQFLILVAKYWKK